jgi:hypothetical protein
MQHEHGPGDDMRAASALVIAERAGQARDSVRAVGTYALAVALVVVTITGLLAAVILAH